MITKKPTKGRLYCGIADGLLDYGYYLGRVPGWLLFEETSFCQGRGIMARGVKDQDAPLWTWIEIPKEKESAERATISYVQSVLPQ